MIKARVNKAETEISFEGMASDIAIEAGFLMYHLIDALRETGRKDEFIRGMFEIAMRQSEDE